VAIGAGRAASRGATAAGGATCGGATGAGGAGGAAGGGLNVPMAAGGAGRRTTVAPGLKPLATLTGGADRAAAGGAADVAVAAAWWWFGGAAKLMAAGGWTAGCAGCCGDGVHAGAGCGQAAGLWVAALCDGGTGDA